MSPTSESEGYHIVSPLNTLVSSLNLSNSIYYGTYSILSITKADPIKSNSKIVKIVR